MSNIRDEFDDARAKERRWAEKIQGGEYGDSGSYCEKADPQYTRAVKIKSAYAELANLLLDWERRYS